MSSRSSGWLMAGVCHWFADGTGRSLYSGCYTGRAGAQDPLFSNIWPGLMLQKHLLADSSGRARLHLMDELSRTDSASFSTSLY